MVQHLLIVRRIWTQTVYYLHQQTCLKIIGSDFRRGCINNLMNIIRPFTVATEKSSKVTLRINERKCSFIVTKLPNMAQQSWKKDPSGQDEILREISHGRTELSDADIGENSETQKLLSDDNLNETETKPDSFIENWLEDGFGNLFDESQILKEVPTRRKQRKSKQTKSPVDRGMTDDAEDGPSKSKKKKKQASKPTEAPDHFIALKISNPKIQKGFADIQEKIVSQSSPLKDAMVSVRKLHVTVMPICLPTQDRLDRAKTALDVSAARLSEAYRDKLVVLSVAGLGHFRNSVLFAKVIPSDPSQHQVLQHISDVVNDVFAEYEIKNTDKKSDFKPHVTIAKLSKNFRKLRQKGIKKIEPSLYEDEVDKHFGHQVLTTIQLCSMFKKDHLTGYYKILHEASFGPQEISNLTIEQHYTVTSAADIIVQWSVKSAVDRCLSERQTAEGNDTSNIKSEKSRVETVCLHDACEKEHLIHHMKLYTDCDSPGKNTTIMLDSQTSQADRDSEEEAPVVSAENNIKAGPDDDPKESSKKNTGDENNDSHS